MTRPQAVSPIDVESRRIRSLHTGFLRSCSPTFSSLLTLVLLLVSGPKEIWAQGSGSPKGGGGGAGANQSATGSPSGGAGGAAGGGAGSLPGISFSKGSWKSNLQRVPTSAELGIGKANVVVLCYKLAYGNSAAIPFILESLPSSTVAQWQPNKEYQKGQLVVPTNHIFVLYSNDHYYKAESTGWSGQDAAVFGTANGKTRKVGTIYWKDMGSFAWSKKHRYEKGAVIAPKGDQSNFYQTKSGGISGDKEPNFQPGKDSPEDNGKLTWSDVGNAGVSSFPSLCANVTPSEPLLMNQVMAVGIDMSSIDAETQNRFHLLNLNLTNQQGSPINPTPIRPGLAASTATGPAVSSATVNYEGNATQTSSVYYLTWPNQLPGDTIPTIGVNLIYSPVAPALPWKPGTFYPAGSVVISKVGKGPAKTTNGHYYLALNSGTSAATSPDFTLAAVPVPTFVDGLAIGWKDMGPAPVPWQKNTAFDGGTLIEPAPSNGHYYRASIIDPSSSSGTTGPTPPTFPTNGSSINDGQLTWQDMGPAPVPWQKNTAFARGVFVLPNPPNGHYYQAQTSGTTGAISPGFPKNGTVVADGPGLVWQEAGPTTIPPIWKPSHAYAQGAPVTPDPANGRYYQAQAQNGKSGTSDKTQPAFPVDLSTVPDSKNLSWKDMGPSPVFPSWQANTAFGQGAFVVPAPANGHYYRALMDGVTGLNQPPFPTTQGSTVTEASNLVWTDAGAALPSSAKNIKTWTPNTAFFVGDVIQLGSSGHYYSAVQAGISGTALPDFYIPAPGKVAEGNAEAQIKWQDLGSSPPASSTLGTTPSDQTVNLLTYTLPQVHTLSYFNLAAGVVMNSNKTPTFTNTGSSSAPNWISTKNGVTFDPILALTAYFKPIDAERPWHKADLIPGATIGFSLTSPSTNFYFGGSSEFPKLRNVQITYGLALSRVGKLEPPYTSSTAITDQVFSKGAFVGLTFNITGFIQSLF